MKTFITIRQRSITLASVIAVSVFSTAASGASMEEVTHIYVQSEQCSAEVGGYLDKAMGSPGIHSIKDRSKADAVLELKVTRLGRESNDVAHHEFAGFSNDATYLAVLKGAADQPLFEATNRLKVRTPNTMCDEIGEDIANRLKAAREGE